MFPQVDAQPRHPSQLYELGLEGFLLFALLWIYARRRRPMGAVSGLFLIGYGSFRFIVEYAREPDNFLRLAGDGAIDGAVAVAADDCRRHLDDAVGLLARAQGAADDLWRLVLVHAAVVAVHHAADRSRSHRRERCPEVDRQQQQRQRHQIGHQAGDDQQDRRKNLAPAVEQPAQQWLVAAQRGQRLGAEGDAFMPQQRRTRNRRREQQCRSGNSPSTARSALSRSRRVWGKSVQSA